MHRRKLASRSSEPAAQPAPSARPRREAPHGLGNLDVQRSVKGVASAIKGSSGTPLSESVAGPMQARLGDDFLDVRVHTDARAGRAASSLDARAFTVGTDMYFAPGEFRPSESDGERLLAHELTHVVQQRNASIDVGSVEPQGSAAEREADATASDVSAGRAAKPASATPRGIPRDVGWARRGEIPDAYGMGYNTIYKNAGPDSKGAVLALASLETPRMFVDLEAYKKLEAPVRKSILALEPHAAGTACAGWFDVMRANDPDFKPVLTAEQIRAGEAAYYGSMRESILEKKVESAKTELPKLDRVGIEAKWQDNKYGFIAVAKTPNHGLKADALFGIWIKYWSDKYKFAEDLRNAIVKRESEADFDKYFRKLNEYEDGDRNAMGPDYAKARADIALAELMFRHSVHAMELCRAADDQGRSLTLDELTQMVVDWAKFWDPMVGALELYLTFGRGGFEPIRTEPIKTEPIKTEPIKTEPIKTEPIKTEPIKTEPIKTEPVKTEPVKTEPVKVEAKAPPKFPANECPESDATWKQWPPPQPAGDKPDWDKPGGARYRYDRYRYQKWEESGKPATPPKDVLSPEKYFDRYVAPKAVGQSPGEMGSPEHKALVVGVRDANSIGTQTMGEQRPDAVGKIDQAIKIPDGPTVTPQKGGRVLYEADNFFKDGSQIMSEGREQVRQFRKDNPDATIVVQDAANPKNIIVYEPGTQPPPPGPLKPGAPNKVPVK